jgi:ribosomal protein L29
MDTTTTCPNAIELLRSLSIDEVEARLTELKAEQDALRTVLRSVKARERAKRRSQKQGVTN